MLLLSIFVILFLGFLFLWYDKQCQDKVDRKNAERKRLLEECRQKGELPPVECFLRTVRWP